MTVRRQFAVTAIAALVLSAPAVSGADKHGDSGAIAGIVRNQRGVPQTGASVFLYDKSEHVLLHALTNKHGVFAFGVLPVDLYSVRVSLANFVPAVRKKIAVQPGMQSLLYVKMATVISSIELVYASPGQGALMSDDWKWVLKESASTRPVLRVLPATSDSDTNQPRAPVGSVFSNTRGVVSVSGGDAGSLTSSSSQADLGTAFALATSIYGHNEVQLSGNVGYSAHTGLPASGFRTGYSRDGKGPQVAVTVQQVYLPVREGFAMFNGQTDGAPALRSMSVSMHDTKMLTDDLRLDYGGSFDSVSYLDRLNSLNNYARLSYNAGTAGKIIVAMSSGAPPTDLLVDSQASSAGEVSSGGSAALIQGLAALSVLPRLSMLDGHLALQRSQDAEVGYQKSFAGAVFNVTGYAERVTNAAMAVVAPMGAFAVGDLLPDISSYNSILDAGTYQRLGFASSVSRHLGDNFEVGASFGNSGALAPGGQNSGANTADALRTRLNVVQRFWASAHASARIPGTGTIISGSYEWMDYNNAIMPDHAYLTQSPYAATGLNLMVRQPIPQVPGIPGRLEADAELQNALAQGYLPISQGGQQVMLLQAPRALRGGLNFIF